MRYVILLLALVLSTAACSSSTTSPSTTTTTPATFVMTWGSLAFPVTGVGRASSAALAITLWNTGTAAVPVTSVTDSNGGEFPWTATCQVGGTLAAASNCAVTVTFAPSATGARTATLTVNANSTTQPLSLTGTGANVNPQLAITSAGDSAPTVFLLSVTGATPSGSLALHTLYMPAPGQAVVSSTASGWTADASGNLTASVTSDSPGTYEQWFVDAVSGLSTNHVAYRVM